jgi:uncharacterized protein (TIGR03066 family)
MRWRYALACCVTLGLLGLAASSTSFAEDKKEPINKEKLVGTWELLKTAGGFEAGSTFEFTKNGKLKIDIKGENARRDEATFTVEGDTLTNGTAMCPCALALVWRASSHFLNQARAHPEHLRQLRNPAYS